MHVFHACVIAVGDLFLGSPDDWSRCSFHPYLTICVPLFLLGSDLSDHSTFEAIAHVTHIQDVLHGFLSWGVILWIIWRLKPLLMSHMRDMLLFAVFVLREWFYHLTFEAVAHVTHAFSQHMPVLQVLNYLFPGDISDAHRWKPLLTSPIPPVHPHSKHRFCPRTTPDATMYTSARGAQHPFWKILFGWCSRCDRQRVANGRVSSNI